MAPCRRSRTRITGTRWSGPRFFGLKQRDAVMTAVRRCAIYTRKSSEEGLEQAFNSLHAQREACEAYIKSQAHEGWKLVKTAYDDGGLSGGSHGAAGAADGCWPTSLPGGSM